MEACGDGIVGVEMTNRTGWAGNSAFNVCVGTLRADRASKVIVTCGRIDEILPNSTGGAGRGHCSGVHAGATRGAATISGERSELWLELVINYAKTSCHFSGAA